MLHLPRRGRALRHDVLRKKKKSSLLEVGWARETAAGAAPGSSPPQRLVSALQLRLSGGSTRRPVLQATCTARLEERRGEERRCPAAGSLAAPRTAPPSRRGLVQEAGIKAGGALDGRDGKSRGPHTSERRPAPSEPPGHGSREKSCPATQPPLEAHLNCFIKRGWCLVSAQEISTERRREGKQEAEP